MGFVDKADIFPHPNSNILKTETQTCQKPNPSCFGVQAMLWETRELQSIPS